jgi:flagellar FliL protein
MAKEPEPVEDLPSPKEATTPSPSSGKGGIITAVATVAAIPLVMIVTWEFYMMPSLKRLAKEQGSPAPAAEVAPAPAPEAKAEEGAANPEAAGEGSTYEVKDVVANLSGAMRSRYIKVSFTLEGKAKGFPEVMKTNEAKIRDATLAVLSDLTIQDLEEPGVKNVVRGNILQALNQALHGSVVDQLYFSEFVVQ